jgi:hypothetical protein
LRDLGLQARLLGQGTMRLPFVVLAPLARGDEDGELVEARRDRALEAQIIAHRLGAQHHLGASQHRRERPAHGIAAPFGKLG